MILFPILGLLGTALAASSSCQTISLSTSTSEIKTYWNTQTTTIFKTYTKTYQDTTTTTLPDKTTTLANTTTTTIGTVTQTASVVTATSTTTTYINVIGTKTGTIYRVSTVTSLLPQTLPTTTIAPSAGFTPLADYLNAQGHPASRSRQDPVKRGVPFGDAAAATPAALERRQDPQYPNFILCDAFIQTGAATTVTTTKTPAKTVSIKGSLITVTGADVTKKVKVTVTTAPSTTFADTVATVTSERTKFKSTFVDSYTSTTTTTIEQAQPTYYAACAQNNMVDIVDGGAFYQSQTYTGGSSFVAYQGLPAPQNAYECCAACLTMNPPCALAEWSTGGKWCMYLPDNGTCAGSSMQAWFKANLNYPPDVTVFNSNCASWNYLGLTGNVNG